jgi:hypothetical protein
MFVGKFRSMGEAALQAGNSENLSPAQIHAALGYYYDHQVAFDQQITQDFAEADRFESQSSAPRALANSSSGHAKDQRLAGKSSVDTEVCRISGYNRVLTIKL